MRFSTRAIHAGYEPDAVISPEPEIDAGGRPAPVDSDPSSS